MQWEIRRAEIDKKEMETEMLRLVEEKKRE
jgi:hypothetical protein